MRRAVEPFPFVLAAADKRGHLVQQATAVSNTFLSSLSKTGSLPRPRRYQFAHLWPMTRCSRRFALMCHSASSRSSAVACTLKTSLLAALGLSELVSQVGRMLLFRPRTFHLPSSR